MRSTLILAALLGGAATSPAVAVAFIPANLLTNGSFEQVQVTGEPWFIRSFSSLPGWTQIGDGVDLVHNNYEQPTLPVLVDASDGVQFLDMNQAGALGGVEQTVTATAGTVYTLKLDATAWATNSRGGTLGYALYDPASGQTLASGSFTDPTGGAWVTQTLSAAATSGSIGVRIQGLYAAQAGMGLDNVRLTAAPVPEPGEWAILGTGLGVAGFAARQRRKHATA